MPDVRVNTGLKERKDPEVARVDFGVHDWAEGIQRFIQDNFF